MKKRKFCLILAAMLALAGAASAAEKAANPQVRIVTNLGAIELRLHADKAPLSTANFLRYADRGFYNGTLFHRVIPGFMIQGGGFLSGMKPKTTEAPIRNEADNGLKNVTGTIAMARTMDPHSATAQFFINTADNHFLDHRAPTTEGWGYAVFGEVTRGMDVVRKIEKTATHTVGPFENVPVRDVVIEKIERLPARANTATRKPAG